MTDDTFVVRIPSAEVPPDLKPEVERVLAELAPLIAARIKEKRRTDFQSLLDVLLRGIKLRGLDIALAQKQAKAWEAVLENSEWLTAEEIGEHRKFSSSNLSAPANRWKQEGKVFAVSHQGRGRFPRYALDDVFQPIPGLEPVLESINAWLNGRRPRELMGSQPTEVVRAAQRYRASSHG